jgi:hypothetical protein
VDELEKKRLWSREWARRHREKDREAYNAKQREWSRENRESRTASKRRWIEKNHERHRAYEKRWRDENPETVRLMQIKTKYGITREQYEEMAVSQNGKCGSCGITELPGGYRADVDHCHATGKVRGLLCGPCNRMLGNAGDDPEKLKAAVRYLAKHGIGD